MKAKEKLQKEELYREAQEFVEEQRGYLRQNLKVMCDEGSWFILYGPDLASGIGGYGETPEAVMADFKLNWERYKGEEWIKKHQS